MEPSIFTLIIRGESPCHKVYEDDRTMAFMDIQPLRQGQVVVVPKNQVDHLEELPDADYQALMSTVKKIMKRQVEVYGGRSCLKVDGFEVAHAHVKLLPCPTLEDYVTEQAPKTEPDHVQLAAEALKLSF